LAVDVLETTVFEYAGSPEIVTEAPDGTNSSVTGRSWT